MDRPWILLQLADSALPTGGFAHSGGLEAAVQLGAVRTPAELERFLEAALWSAGGATLPFVRAAHAAPARLAELDAACEAFTWSHVARRASRAQGQALLRVAAAAFPAAARLAEAAAAGPLAGHLAPAFGAVAGALGVPGEDASRAWLFCVARGVLSAGVRLGACGPTAAQAALAGAEAAAEEVLAACGSLTVEEVAAREPLLDLLQAHQDRLYSRLFQS